MAVLDVKADAQRALEVLTQGGIGILPNDVGYSLIAAQQPALAKIFQTKQRAPSKLNAMLGNRDLHRELHVVSDRARQIVEAITEDFDLPLGLVAPYRTDHPLLRNLDLLTLGSSTRDGTMLMLLNAGRFHAEITRQSLEAETLLFGSSANLSLSGTKFKVEDIEPQIMAISDVTIDYGLMKYHLEGTSSTLLNCETLEVLRFGSCYENIASVLKRYLHIELPPRPAAQRPALRSS